jgi:hypothetical protein
MFCLQSPVCTINLPPVDSCAINLPPINCVDFPVTCLYPEPATNWKCSVPLTRLHLEPTSNWQCSVSRPLLYSQRLTNWQCSVSRHVFVPWTSYQLTVFSFPSTACTLNLPTIDSVQFPVHCFYPQPTNHWQCSVSRPLFVPSTYQPLTVYRFPPHWQSNFLPILIRGRPMAPAGDWVSNYAPHRFLCLRDVRGAAAVLAFSAGPFTAIKRTMLVPALQRSILHRTWGNYVRPKSLWSCDESHSVKVEVTLRPSVGQSVLVSGAHLGPATNISFSFSFLQTVAGL